MEYCQYHPMDSASHECDDCKTTSCERCVNHDQARGLTLCHICQKPTRRLSSGHNAQPFWRRLDESFRYPVNAQAITIIIAVAVLSSAASLLPFSLIWILIVNGAFFKYGFASLENSTNGDFTAVSMSEALEGGFGIMLQLIIISLGLTAMVAFCGYFLGQSASKLLGAVFLIGVPAIVINFALTKSVLSALNPVSMVLLITTIGLPYGLLLAFIFIMMGSVGIISQLLINMPESLSIILQSAVSCYYTLVVFHIMGYMIFQYQDTLGFSTTEDHDETTTPYDHAKELKAEIIVWVKEGDADKVLDLYNKAIGKYPNDHDIFNMCYRFLVETKNTPRLKAFSRLYFDHLINNNNVARMSQVFKEIRTLDTKFTLENPHHRHVIAKSCFEKGDFMTAIKLLHNLHTSNPEYSELGESYDILAQALELSPKYKDRAESIKKLATVFKKKQNAKKTESNKNKPNKHGFDTQTKSSSSSTRPLKRTLFTQSNSLQAEPLEIDLLQMDPVENTNGYASSDLPLIDFPGVTDKK